MTMPITVTDLPPVRDLLEKHQIEGSGDFLFLPRGFVDQPDEMADLAHESESFTLAKVLSARGISVAHAQPGDHRFPVLAEHSLSWIGPVIFIAYSVASSSPQVVTLGLNVLSDYLADFFRGTFGVRRARLDIIIEDASGACRRVHYDGPPEGLREVGKALQGIGFRGGE